MELDTKQQEPSSTLIYFILFSTIFLCRTHFPHLFKIINFKWNFNCFICEMNDQNTQEQVDEEKAHRLKHRWGLLGCYGMIFGGGMLRLYF